MASIDKIYGTMADYLKLVSWAYDNQPKLFDWIYDPRYDLDFQEERALSSFSNAADVWLWEHCPLDFARNRLEEQYGGVPTRNPKPSYKKTLDEDHNIGVYLVGLRLLERKVRQAELIRGKEFISKQSHVESFMEGLISEEELSRLLGVDQIEARAIVQQIEQEKAEWVEELRRYEERIT